MVHVQACVNLSFIGIYNRIMITLPVCMAGPMVACSSLTCASSVALSTSSIGESKPTILNKLCCPQQSTLGKKRTISHNKPPRGKRKASGKVAADPKPVMPSQKGNWIQKLFYMAHHKQFILKDSAVLYHVKWAICVTPRFVTVCFWCCCSKQVINFGEKWEIIGFKKE